MTDSLAVLIREVFESGMVAIPSLEQCREAKPAAPKGQRAMIAAQIANTRHAERTDLSPNGPRLEKSQMPVTLHVRLSENLDRQFTAALDAIGVKYKSHAIRKIIEEFASVVDEGSKPVWPPKLLRREQNL